jgi:hypothetical protein
MVITTKEIDTFARFMIDFLCIRTEIYASVDYLYNRSTRGSCNLYLIWSGMMCVKLLNCNVFMLS